MSQGASAGTSDSVQRMVEAARGGNRQAFAGLVEAFQPDLFRMLYYRTRSRMDAEDLTQDVFAQAFGSLERLQHAARFRSWLFSIALNRIRDFHRRKKVRTLFALSARDEEPEMDSGDAGAQLMRREFWEQVDRLLRKLSRGEREVFVMRFMDQLSIPEICGVTGKNESTIKTQLYRALQKFRQEPGLLGVLGEGMP